MLTAVAVVASVAFFGWLIYRAVKGKLVRAYMVTRVLSYVAGVYTFAFFLSMDLPRLIQVLVSILLGAMVIVLAAYLQRRKSRKAD